MLRYTVTRLLQGALMVFAVTILVFSLLYLMPGDPVETMLGTRVEPERKAEIEHEMGLDRPLTEQYFDWLGDAVKLDFGKSITTKLPVMQSLKNRIPVTLKLSLTALIVELLIAIPLGVLAAYRKDGLYDRLVIALSTFFQSIPNFWIAILLIYFFSIRLRWFPVNGIGTMKHYVLPVISVTLAGIAGALRMTKNEVLDVLHENYINAAYAKGLPSRKVAVNHVLRNSLTAVTVMIFMQIPWLISGSVIIENVFAIPGMGTLMTNAITAQDFPVVQACILIIAVLTVVFNLLGDIVSAILDPRIRVAISGGA